MFNSVRCRKWWEALERQSPPPSQEAPGKAGAAGDRQMGVVRVFAQGKEGVWSLSALSSLLRTVLKGQPRTPPIDPVWQVEGRVQGSTFQHTDSPTDPQAP